MEGLINDYASFDMEDALEDFKRFIKGIQGFCTSLGAISPLTSMLEDEQSFKHGGDCYSKYLKYPCHTSISSFTC
jgi:hypothetical protein